MGTQIGDLITLYQEHLAESGRSTFTIKNYISNLKLFRRWYEKTYEVSGTDCAQVRDIDLLSYRNFTPQVVSHSFMIWPLSTA